MVAIYEVQAHKALSCVRPVTRVHNVGLPPADCLQGTLVLEYGKQPPSCFVLGTYGVSRRVGGAGKKGI